MIIQLTLMGELISKPRGKLGKHGNIYHNDAKYVSFKQQIDRQMSKALMKGQKHDYPLGVALLSEFTSRKRGNEYDLADNQLGALLDILVQSEYIADDSRKYLRESIVRGIESDRNYATFWLYSSEEIDTVWQQVNDKYEAIKKSLNLSQFKPRYGTFRQ